MKSKLSTKAASAGPGFNAEYHERSTGWQILGNGYRVYNPVLMRFHSPDSLSPFGKGGLNAYAYCAGDPINQVDPSGHFGKIVLRNIKDFYEFTGSNKPSVVKAFTLELTSDRPGRMLYALAKEDVENVRLVWNYQINKKNLADAELADYFSGGFAQADRSLRENTLFAKSALKAMVRHDKGKYADRYLRGLATDSQEFSISPKASIYFRVKAHRIRELGVARKPSVAVTETAVWKETLEISAQRWRKGKKLKTD